MGGRGRVCHEVASKREYFKFHSRLSDETAARKDLEVASSVAKIEDNSTSKRSRHSDCPAASQLLRGR